MIEAQICPKEDRISFGFPLHVSCVTRRIIVEDSSTYLISQNIACWTF